MNPTQPPRTDERTARHRAKPLDRTLALLRISLGWIFLWPFLDKTFGLGFTTASADAWIRGGSPTSGFLTFATRGPFASAFRTLAGSTLADWVFMIGLLGIGLALILGVGMKIAVWSGSLMLVLMWLAALPPEHNPFLDDHLIYPIGLFACLFGKAQRTWGLGAWWSSTAIVQRYPFLE